MSLTELSRKKLRVRLQLSNFVERHTSLKLKHPPFPQRAQPGKKLWIAFDCTSDAVNISSWVVRTQS